MVVATEDARTLARRDLSGLKRLRKSIGEQLAYVEVPEFDRDVHELGSLARLSGYLVGRQAGSDVGVAVDDSSADSVSIGAP
jgi:hypothetical protein